MRVQPPDLELWLCDYVRALAAAEDVDVDVTNAESDDLQLPLERPVLVLREDPGSRLDHTTFDRAIGASVIGGSESNPKPTRDLARWLAGILFDLELPLAAIDCPIVSVDPDGCNGPYPVTEELDVARMYLTAQYTVVGSW